MKKTKLLNLIFMNKNQKAVAGKLKRIKGKKKIPTALKFHCNIYFKSTVFFLKYTHT